MSHLRGIIDDDGTGLTFGTFPLGTNVDLWITSSVACEIRPLGSRTTPLPVPADKQQHFGIIDLGKALVDQTVADETVGWWGARV